MPLNVKTKKNVGKRRAKSKAQAIKEDGKEFVEEEDRVSGIDTMKGFLLLFCKGLRSRGIVVPKREVDRWVDKNRSKMFFLIKDLVLLVISYLKHNIDEDGEDHKLVDLLKDHVEYDHWFKK